MHERPETLVKFISKTLNTDKPVDMTPNGPTAFDLTFANIEGLSHNTTRVRIVHKHGEGWKVGLIEGLDRDQIMLLLDS